MNTLIHQIRQELKQQSDEKTRSSAQRFFKEPVEVYGVKTAVVGKIGKAYFKAIKSWAKEDIFNLCEELWRSGRLEETYIACNWSYFVRQSYEPADFEVFATWVHDYVTNWASCDTLCNHAIGSFVDRYPDHLSHLKIWARSGNRWVRRASAVSLIIPAKQGRFLKDILDIAAILLLDDDDMVRKGYGWMLKAASHTHQKEVFDYVTANKAVMPRTALRYAIEKMPEELRQKAMVK